MLETRPAPAHRRIAADFGSHRASAVSPRGRGTAATLAGGALSIAGATAAGWVAANHLPALLDVVLETDAAPAARTVVLVAQGSATGDEAPAEPPATVDPAAVVASATQSATAPKPVNTQVTPAAPSTARPSTDRDGESSTESDSTDSDLAESNSNSRESGSDSRDTGSTGSDRPDSATASNADPDRDPSPDRESDRGSSSPQGSDTDSENTSGSGSDGSASDGSASDGSGSDTDSNDTASNSSGASDPGTNAVTSSASGARASTGSPGLPPAPRGTGTGNLPSDIIDTKDWYLTLPTGKEGSPDLVEGSALARYHSQFFDLTSAKDGVVFTAATNGATTSGSHYPRSELREMFGSEKASWDGRKGRHTMEIVQAITETPKEKPDVIAGQIHGTSDDLMQIHLSGNRLTVKYADGQKFVDLDPNYKLGTMFAVKIESAGGRVKVWYNGQQKADLPISSSTSYFKAGVYTNSNPSKGDKSGEGQVVIRSLAVRHE